MIPGVPYDAEVEYLESTGTQWIDTGVRTIPVVSSFDMSMTIRFTSVPGSNYAGSGYTSNKEQMFYALNPNQSIGLYMACNGRTDIAKVLSLDQTAWHTCSAKTENGSVSYFFDSTLISSFPFYGFTLPCFYLFVLGVPGFGLNGLIGYQQISAARLSVDSEPVFDFVPVRFTNEQGVSEGAMYDRVSKRLFRNHGTGAFVIGPDVATPVMGLRFFKPKFTAADYVQDGLIAMWDGIENAGWEVHDQNATVWKDLVGGFDAALTNYGAFDSNSLIGNGDVLAQAQGTPTFTTCEAMFWLDGTIANGIRTIFKSVGQNPQINCGVSYADGSKQTAMGWFQRGCYVDGYDVPMSVTAFSSNSMGQNGQIREIHSEAGWGNNKAYTGPTFFATPSHGGAWAFAGTAHIYCVRLYSRALTADEIASNYAIDRARFNLT